MTATNMCPNFGGFRYSPPFKLGVTDDITSLIDDITIKTIKGWLNGGWGRFCCCSYGFLW